MNNESAPETRAPAAPGAVIKPWLSAVLIFALAGNVLLSAILIIKLSGFEDMKRRADETEAEAATNRTELASLQADVDSLSQQKDALAPTVADWEKRLKEKAVAEAALANMEGKRQQAELDIAQAGKHLEEISRNVLESEKQKAELDSAIERLKSELVSLTKTNTDAKALLTLASEAERRLDDATNALASTDARRKQFDADATAAQTRLDQLQKEADDLRQTREKSNTESATLRQQIQSFKDQLATFDQQAADLKARQAAVGQEEQKLAKLQQQVAGAEARATEIEARQQQATSELALLTNRVDQARSQAADWETKRDINQQAGTKAAQDLAAAQKILFETQASQDQLSRDQAKLIAQISASKLDLEQSRKDAAEAEVRLETVKAAFQKADADLAATRKLSQEFSAKQGELTREVSGLEATIERLKKGVAPVSLRSAKKRRPCRISAIPRGRVRETDGERMLASQPQPTAAIACS
jgi:chromosome segregation ATPase